MRLREWPNKLGWDYRDYEIFKHSEGFSVRGDHRSMLVPFQLAADPATALRVCMEHGCRVKELDGLDYSDARQRFLNQWRNVISTTCNKSTLDTIHIEQ